MSLPPREQARAMRLEGLGVEEIAERLKTYPNVVRNWLHNESRPNRPAPHVKYRPRGLPEDRWQAFVDMWLTKATVTAVAAEFRMDNATASRWAYRSGLPKKAPTARKKREPKPQ